MVCLSTAKFKSANTVNHVIWGVNDSAYTLKGGVFNLKNFWLRNINSAIM